MRVEGDDCLIYFNGVMCMSKRKQIKQKISNVKTSM